MDITSLPFPQINGQNKMKRGKDLHETELQEFIQRMRSEGKKIIDLAGKSPDAIMVKDGKLIAVEILPSRFSKSKQKWVHSWSYKEKKEIYSMFDDVIIIEYKNTNGVELTANPVIF